MTIDPPRQTRHPRPQTVVASPKQKMPIRDRGDGLSIALGLIWLGSVAILLLFHLLEWKQNGYPYWTEVVMVMSDIFGWVIAASAWILTAWAAGYAVLLFRDIKASDRRARRREIDEQVRALRTSPLHREDPEPVTPSERPPR